MASRSETVFARRPRVSLLPAFSMTDYAETAGGLGVLRWLTRPILGPRRALAQGSLPVVSAERLLAQGDRPALRRRIDRLLSVPRPQLATLFHGAILGYARFVQQLPASEAHHHAGAGGMLDHGLEVVANALALRRGHLLPQGAEPERLARGQDLWTYAVFTAALLHDIGKPAVDQRVLMLDARQRPLGTWDPWQGPMGPRALWYRVEFVRDRARGLHERVAPLLARFIVPAAGLAWLASDREVLAAWVATISGDRDNGGALGEIIGRADGESVARNLGAGDSMRLPTARARPLHEKLLTALRHLIAEGELPLNRDGAAGWLVDNDLWLVSKRTADALRTHLLREGHEGIPSRNDRIFDVLQEHGLAVSNGERAIWRARVAGDGWAHELTLLRISAARVWPEPDRRPDAFIGTVTPLEQTNASTNADLEQQATPAPSHGHNAKEQTTREAEQDESGIPIYMESRTTNEESSDTVSTSETSEASDAGKQFLTWLRDGVAARRIQVNTVNARVHVVPEGVLLVSPGIFRDFAAQHPKHEWSNVQKRFQKLKLHRKTETGTNIHAYRVTGERKRSSINGLLLPDAAVVFGTSSPPLPNPHLSRKE